MDTLEIDPAVVVVVLIALYFFGYFALLGGKVLFRRRK